MPTVPVLELTFKAPVRNPRTYTPTEGSNAGKTYYTADAELLTPGSRWLSVRLKVTSKTPIVDGVQTLCLDQLDGKGSGVSHIVREV